MGQTVPDIEIREDLYKRVRDSDKVILRCFYSTHAEDESYVFKTANKTAAGASSGLTASFLESLPDQVVCCGLDLSCHADVATGLGLADAGEHGLESAGSASSGSMEACWVFFRAGKQIYVAPGSTPLPQLMRLVALLKGNPDTLEQLAQQEQVSSKQRNKQEEMLEGAGGEEGGRAAPVVRIFVGGDRSQVGKSSTCLGLLGALLKHGLSSNELAYIKPATQCEKPQLVTEWCESRGVACRGIGPVVFYKGFTREFLRGGAGTSEDLLREIQDAVDQISRGKKVVIIDGVGHPAVGSICGVSNGDVAAALKAPVLLVGKSGVGDAVDSYNLNACFFEARGVRVLGGVFNRLSTEGFYSLDRCREAVTSYFSQSQPKAMPYGFVPEIPALKTKQGSAGTTRPEQPAAPPPKTQQPTSSPSTMATAAPSTEERAVSPGQGTRPPLPPPGGAEDGGGDEGSGTMAGPMPCLPVTAIASEEDVLELVETAGKERLVLLDFGAEWCKNCKVLVPMVHSLPASYGGAVAVGTVDVDEAAEVADNHSVTAIPHFVLVKGGVKVDAYAGSSEVELHKRIKQYFPGAHELPDVGGDAGHNDGDRTAAVDSRGVKDGRGGMAAAEALIEVFSSHVDVARLLRDIREHSDSSWPISEENPPGNRDGVVAINSSSSTTGIPAAGGSVTHPSPAIGAVVRNPQGASRGLDDEEAVGKAGTDRGGPLEGENGKEPRRRKTREEVEADAAKQGASGG